MSNDLLLKRTYRPYVTFGELFLPNGVSVKTLERPWINNAPNVSCIPEGKYQVEWLERSASGKYKRCWHVTGVEGRFGILIHAGNIVSHTTGCILVGSMHGTLGGRAAVLRSKPALNKLRRELEGKDFRLIIE